MFMIPDYCCFCYVLRTVKSFTIFWCRPHTPHGGWLLSHAIPIMREILHYTQDGKRNYKSTNYASTSIVSMV